MHMNKCIFVHAKLGPETFKVMAWLAGSLLMEHDIALNNTSRANTNLLTMSLKPKKMKLKCYCIKNDRGIAVGLFACLFFCEKVSLLDSGTKDSFYYKNLESDLEP